MATELEKLLGFDLGTNQWNTDIAEVPDSVNNTEEEEPKDDKVLVGVSGRGSLKESNFPVYKGSIVE